MSRDKKENNNLKTWLFYFLQRMLPDELRDNSKATNEMASALLKKIEQEERTRSSPSYGMRNPGNFENAQKSYEGLVFEFVFAKAKETFKNKNPAVKVPMAPGERGSTEYNKFAKDFNEKFFDAFFSDTHPVPKNTSSRSPSSVAGTPILTPKQTEPEPAVLQSTSNRSSSSVASTPTSIPTPKPKPEPIKEQTSDSTPQFLAQLRKVVDEYEKKSSSRFSRPSPESQELLAKLKGYLELASHTSAAAFSIVAIQDALPALGDTFKKILQKYNITDKNERLLFFAEGAGVTPTQAQYNLNNKKGGVVFTEESPFHDWDNVQPKTLPEKISDRVEVLANLITCNPTSKDVAVWQTEMKVCLLIKDALGNSRKITENELQEICSKTPNLIEAISGNASQEKKSPALFQPHQNIIETKKLLAEFREHADKNNFTTPPSTPRSES